MMNYKGYEGVAELDDVAGIFHGQVIGIRGVVTFRGAAVEELRQSFRESMRRRRGFKFATCCSIII